MCGVIILTINEHTRRHGARFDVIASPTKDRARAGGRLFDVERAGGAKEGCQQVAQPAFSNSTHKFVTSRMRTARNPPGEFLQGSGMSACPRRGFGSNYGVNNATMHRRAPDSRGTRHFKAHAPGVRAAHTPYRAHTGDL